jgi:hypothetical protein
MGGVERLLWPKAGGVPWFKRLGKPAVALNFERLSPGVGHSLGIVQPRQPNGPRCTGCHGMNLSGSCRVHSHGATWLGTSNNRA